MSTPCTTANVPPRLAVAPRPPLAVHKHSPTTIIRHRASKRLPFILLPPRWMLQPAPIAAPPCERRGRRSRGGCCGSRLLSPLIEAITTKTTKAAARPEAGAGLVSQPRRSAAATAHASCDHLNTERSEQG